MWVHFIAIGGAAMHNLAMALHMKGYRVTGSDDQIFEPSRSRLNRYGLLPPEEGWQPGSIHSHIDAVILGMHARADNPELLRARELGLMIYSFPEYVFEQTRHTKRIVIGGSHGKTTITAMVLHVLHRLNISASYLVGAQLEGYDCMVRLADEDQWAIIEGDEYLSSPADRRPKFHLYCPHVALISGIAWDHINVFPTEESYISQFAGFAERIEAGGTLIYCSEDDKANQIAANARADISKVPYRIHRHRIKDGVTYLQTPSGEVAVKVFGPHNLVNLTGALEVCGSMGINADAFYEAIRTFSGASRRLEQIGEKHDGLFYKDFAHAPSKLKATVKAVHRQYPGHKLIACIELHTFSSLNPGFISNYRGSLAEADEGHIYFSPEAVAHKKLPPLDPQQVKQAFGGNNLKIHTQSDELVETLKNADMSNTNILMMSSGNFGGIDLNQLARELGYRVGK